MSPYQLHVLKWKDCKRCPLCEVRQRVVLCRGDIPCHVLFIGEAPGPSEDVLGQPFKGPAGKLLDEIVRQSFEGRLLYHAFTNLVACIPRGEDGIKFSEPEAQEIKSCSPRLNEIVNLCMPRLIVCVGALARKWIDLVFDRPYCQHVNIEHPASILRTNVIQQGLAIQRAVVTLRNALEDLE